jgi:hypothetical protein
MDYIVSAFGWSAYLQNLSKSSIWENIILCWKPSTNNINWIKKEESTIIIMDYWGGSDLRSVKADRLICKSFQIVNLREIKKKSLLCWMKKRNYIYWGKRELVEGEVIGINFLKP